MPEAAEKVGWTHTSGSWMNPCQRQLITSHETLICGSNYPSKDKYDCVDHETKEIE